MSRWQFLCQFYFANSVGVEKRSAERIDRVGLPKKDEGIASD